VELFLNIAWALLAMASVGLWVRYGRKERAQWYLPLIALAVLIVLLFPVISVSDDLYAIQNPAESDSWCRRHDTHASSPLLLTTAALPETMYSGVPLGSARCGVLCQQKEQPADSGMDDSFQNRPPPQA
jgi:hypothetical protein